MRKKLGFSLVEVIATFVVISILVGITSQVAPVILNKFYEKEIENNLKIAIQKQFGFAVKSGYFTDNIEDLDLLSNSNELILTNLNSKTPNTISIHVLGDGSVVLSGMSKNSKCFGYFLASPLEFEDIIKIDQQENIVCSAKIMRSYKI